MISTRCQLFAVLLCAAAGAQAACPEKMSRDPTFVALAVQDGAPRPKSVDDFRFITDTTTLEELQAKIGSPDAAKGERTFVWCLPDGVIVTVSTRTGSDIRYVRAGKQLIYRRK